MIGKEFYYNMSGRVGRGKVVSKATGVPYEGEYWDCVVFCTDGTWGTNSSLILQTRDMYESMAEAIDAVFDQWEATAMQAIREQTRQLRENLFDSLSRPELHK